MKATNQIILRLVMGCVFALGRSINLKNKSVGNPLRRIAGIALLAGLACQQASLGQIAPQLTIQKPSTTQLKLGWTAQTGTNYQPDFAAVLDVFAFWSPLGNSLLASSNSLQVTFVQPTNTQQFYRVRSLPDDGYPSVRIISPTNGATVGGLVKVAVSAKDDRRLSAVSLYLDGEPIQTITAGELVFTFDSTHYANGSHGIYAVAQDNAGISYLGGDPNTSTVFNETQSATYTLNFQNTLRWLNADHLFDSTVSIIAESDIFPTDYTVFVEDAAGNTVRMFTEQTLDGQIQTAWDGLDGLGNPVDAEHPYEVIIALGDLTSPPAAALASSTSGFASKTAAVISWAWKVNQYGYQDLEVITLVDSPTPAPLPPLPPKLVKKNGQVVVEEAPVLIEVALPVEKSPAKQIKHIRSRHQVSLAATEPVTTESSKFVSETTSLQTSAAAASSSGSDSSRSTYYKESPWSSGRMLLARQVLSQAPTLWNTSIASLLNNIMNQVNIADLDIGPNRDVYQNIRLACSAPADYTQLMSLLADPSIRNFYYSGHSSGNSIGFSDSVPNNGITSSNLSSTLTNKWNFVKGDPSKLYFEFGKPFRFVYIDGCNSANGWFPEAFGIPLQIKNGYKSRAYMGWTVISRYGLLNNDHRLFTERFWNRWVGDEDYTKLLTTARDEALASTPSINVSEIRIFGSPGLAWGD